ncbi:hypothetical protein INS49_014320 [Diaporthe citri]|uniref:uncharacterized protein n=1 Tax=Diaporthe citri TaxID=83186 RepID=UPI001C8234B0|nr:uncharacterized protein INS49_014320 [Diaporthe citri]KAG6358436.1 hypothetical protein INS49_014320 [Diaporthe citri]
MKLSQSIQISALLAGIASAFPSPPALTETIMLSNGTMTVAVEVESSEVRDERAILCRSSTTGGAKSGVCSGNCGIFVQNGGCSRSGADLRNGYNAVRSGGCQACGSFHDDGGCLITVNFVTGC